MNNRLQRALKALMAGVAGMVGFVALLQIIPYGRTHSNPPTVSEPAWDSPRTRELAVRACFDCHSNETRWPWYANVAPFSWAMQFDVEAAREVVNFSEWDRHYDLASYAGRRTSTGMMPPSKYLLAHPEAKLTPQERMELARGLDATLKQTQSRRD
ncbi:MAG: heme-binding domain-containing protein [Myxococcota bacterium]|nr:heme-binding domain-containing protein [Myxococcota bacterium]